MDLDEQAWQMARQGARPSRPKTDFTLEVLDAAADLEARSAIR
jgi:hypothetical protein